LSSRTAPEPALSGGLFFCGRPPPCEVAERLQCGWPGLGRARV